MICADFPPLVRIEPFSALAKFDFETQVLVMVLCGHWMRYRLLQSPDLADLSKLSIQDITRKTVFLVLWRLLTV